jgi:CRISPR-associated endonuclease/helicase Cas3
MSSLLISDFDDYFWAIHGVAPFPWQRRLCKRVAENGWPSLLDLPTGSGKTAAIDVAVFHLALEARRGVERRAPIRILFTVDRRIIVDAAYERACKIGQALKQAGERRDESVLSRTAEALLQLAGPDADPVVAVRLRGGVPHDTDWAKSPSQPLVAVSTVDQVGSRLLFRGYGVTRRMWPVHAGLVGADALWLLDEVHLAKPLDQTLSAISEGHGPGGLLATAPRASPFVSARLSATPGDDETGDAFRLDADDRRDGVLASRLTAAKPTTLVAYRGETVTAFVREVERLTGDGRSHRIAVVVNTVRAARAVFDRLREALPQPVRCSLLIGRIREVDRNAVVEGLRDLLAAPQRPDPSEPHILVATQTVETGADFDVDALVTEVAPLDALRQRFGRLNRLGRPIDAAATILLPERSEREHWNVVEAVYGPAARETANWLQEVAKKNVVDFGIDAMDATVSRCEPERMAGLMAPKASAPTMLPSYVDDWATTSPPSAATPEPDLFLHGRRTVRDVQLVWRADVPTPHGHDEIATMRARMETSMLVAPPASPEVLELPIHHAKRLIERNYLPDAARGIGSADTEPLADVSIPDEHGQPRLEPPRRTAWCWRYRYSQSRSDRYRWVPLTDVRPGDLLIVPSTYGGYDDHGWSEHSTVEVRDVGLQANRDQRDRLTLRVTFETLRNALLDGQRVGSDDDTSKLESDTRMLWSRISARVTAADGDATRVIDALIHLEGLPTAWGDVLALMGQASVRRLPYDDGGDPAADFGLFVSSAARWRKQRSLSQPSVTGDDDSSTATTPVTLEAHSHHVAAFARRFAEALGLDTSLCDAVAMAALLHDAGKIDPRFQADLRGMAALYALGLTPAEGTEPLAKSTRSFDPRAPRATPRGFRHEAFSVALAQTHPKLSTMVPELRDLVLWLIGTHHGFGRPFFPPTSAEGAELVELRICGTAMSAAPSKMPIAIDSGWLELRSRVLRRWGAWESARFEALLRLADHAASAAEADGTIDRLLEKSAHGI